MAKKEKLPDERLGRFASGNKPMVRPMVNVLGQPYRWPATMHALDDKHFCIVTPFTVLHDEEQKAIAELKDMLAGKNKTTTSTSSTSSVTKKDK